MRVACSRADIQHRAAGKRVIRGGQRARRRPEGAGVVVHDHDGAALAVGMEGQVNLPGIDGRRGEQGRRLQHAGAGVDHSGRRVTAGARPALGRQPEVVRRRLRQARHRHARPRPHQPVRITGHEVRGAATLFNGQIIQPQQPCVAGSMLEDQPGIRGVGIGRIAGAPDGRQVVEPAVAVIFQGPFARRRPPHLDARQGVGVPVEGGGHHRRRGRPIGNAPQFEVVVRAGQVDAHGIAVHRRPGKRRVVGRQVEPEGIVAGRIVPAVLQVEAPDRFAAPQRAAQRVVDIVGFFRVVVVMFQRPGAGDRRGGRVFPLAGAIKCPAGEIAIFEIIRNERGGAAAAEGAVRADIQIIIGRAGGGGPGRREVGEVGRAGPDAGRRRQRGGRGAVVGRGGPDRRARDRPGRVEVFRAGRQPRVAEAGARAHVEHRAAGERVVRGRRRARRRSERAGRVVHDDDGVAGGVRLEGQVDLGGAIGRSRERGRRVDRLAQREHLQHRPVRQVHRFGVGAQRRIRMVAPFARVKDEAVRERRAVVAHAGKLRFQQGAGQDIVVGPPVVGRGGRIRVLVAGLVRRLVVVAHQGQQDGQRRFRAVREVQVACDRQVVARVEAGRGDVVRQFARFGLANGRVRVVRPEVHADQIQVLRARQVDLGMDEVAGADVAVGPFVAGHDRPAADDAVRNRVLAAFVLHIVVVVGAEVVGHELGVAVGDHPLLDRHHVRQQRLQQALPGVVVGRRIVDRHRAAHQVGRGDREAVVVADEQGVHVRSGHPAARRLRQREAHRLGALRRGIVVERDLQVRRRRTAGGEHQVRRGRGEVRAARQGRARDRHPHRGVRRAGDRHGEVEGDGVVFIGHRAGRAPLHRRQVAAGHQLEFVDVIAVILVGGGGGLVVANPDPHILRAVRKGQHEGIPALGGGI